MDSNDNRHPPLAERVREYLERQENERRQGGAMTETPELGNELEMDESAEEYISRELEAPGLAELEYDEHQKEEALERERHRRLLYSSTMREKKYTDQAFLIGPDLLPKGGRMLLTAENGTGKSAVALYIAACLANEQPLFGLLRKKKDRDFNKPVFPTHGKSFVVYVDYEIPESIRELKRLGPLRKSFERSFDGHIAFVRQPSNYRLENLQGEKYGHGSFDRFLQLAIDTLPDVLIIDPFSSTHSLDENSNQIKQALNSIDRIIDAVGCAVILIHHSSKPQRDHQGNVIEKSAKEKARGHSAIMDWPDVQLQLNDKPRKGDPHVKDLQLEFGKARYASKPHPRRILADIENMTFVESDNDAEY
jgi:RecA-family ATPase